MEWNGEDGPGGEAEEGFHCSASALPGTEHLARARRWEFSAEGTVKALALVLLVHSLFSRARDGSEWLCFLRVNLPTEDALFPSLEGSSWKNAELGPKGPYLIGFLTS